MLRLCQPIIIGMNSVDFKQYFMRTLSKPQISAKKISKIKITSATIDKNHSCYLNIWQKETKFDQCELPEFRKHFDESPGMLWKVFTNRLVLSFLKTPTYPSSVWTEISAGHKFAYKLHFWIFSVQNVLILIYSLILFFSKSRFFSA